MKAFSNVEFENYKNEVKDKWGKTDAYIEYSEKTKGYSEDKWQSIFEGLNSIFADFAVCMKNGEEAHSVVVQNLVKQLQSYITENYYSCTDEILAGLGQMYVFDERFKNNIDKHGEGTAEFVSKAISVYSNKN